MTSAELLPAAVLNRKAVVYIRQSTQAQVQTNLESRRRQYDLVDVARQRGFHNIEVIGKSRIPRSRSAGLFVYQPRNSLPRPTGGGGPRVRILLPPAESRVRT
jgi:hypothetical protein